MCEIFVAVPLTNECCARRKIAAEQLASASGENPCAHAMENPTLKSGILLAEKQGFEPWLRFTRTTPLAGEPLRPLG